MSKRDYAKEIDEIIGLWDDVAEVYPKATARSSSKWDYVAFDKARDKWMQENGFESLFAVAQAGRSEEIPQRENFRYDPPRVLEYEVNLVSLEELVSALESSGEHGVTIEGIGTLYAVDSYGGEGQGDEYWHVFKIASPEDFDGDNLYTGLRYFKIDGHYSSYGGGHYDEMYEVFPKQVEVTEWTKS